MTIEYAQIANDSIAVTGQVAEGDDLIFGELEYETQNAAVKTVGGWTSFSRQAIERSHLNVVDDAFRALALRYGRAIENAARAQVASALSGAEDLSNALADADDVTECVVDMADYLDGVGLALDGILVDKATFKTLLGMAAADRILQVNQAPESKLGTATLSTLSGNIAGITVTVWPGAPASTFLGYDSTAVRTLTSGGAPWRLQDDNIVNLSRDFSVYGYVATYTQFPDGFVKA